MKGLMVTGILADQSTVEYANKVFNESVPDFKQYNIEIYRARFGQNVTNGSLFEAAKSLQEDINTVHPEVLFAHSVGCLVGLSALNNTTNTSVKTLVLLDPPFEGVPPLGCALMLGMNWTWPATQDLAQNSSFVNSTRLNFTKAGIRVYIFRSGYADPWNSLALQVNAKPPFTLPPGIENITLPDTTHNNLVDKQRVRLWELEYITRWGLIDNSTAWNFPLK